MVSTCLSFLFFFWVQFISIIYLVCIYHKKQKSKPKQMDSELKKFIIFENQRDKYIEYDFFLWGRRDQNLHILEEEGRKFLGERRENFCWKWESHISGTERRKTTYKYSALSTRMTTHCLWIWAQYMSTVIM